MSNAFRNITYALRRLGASPTFTIGAMLTLAIAIGATASVFSLVNGVLLKGFPFHEPGRVVTIQEDNRAEHLLMFGVAPADYLDWRAQNTTFSTLAATEDTQFTIYGSGVPRRPWALAVTPNYFDALGIRPVLGRPLAPDSSGPPEVVISYDYWQQQFGGAPSVVGRLIVLDERAYTIVGVLPPGVIGPLGVGPQLVTRRVFTGADQLNRGDHNLKVYGRLKPGLTREAAQRELSVISERLAQTYPLDKGWSADAEPLLDWLVGRVKPALFILLAAAVCVLLIGAANLANLFLVRFVAQEGAIAIRTALGASRALIVRELLLDAAVLGFPGGALGVALAAAGSGVLRMLAPATLPYVSRVGVDGHVVAFCALTSLVVVFIVGLVPAWWMSRANIADFLKAGARRTGAARHRHMQDALVVLQVAVALVLLTGAALLVESFEHFARIDPGFQSEGVLSAQLDLAPQRYSTPGQGAALVTRLVERLRALPGVTAASASDGIPGGEANVWAFSVVGDAAPASGDLPVARTTDVTPEYIRTMGMKIMRGRVVLPSDDARAVKVAVVDELLVEQYFGGRDPLGRRLSFGRDTVTIVGVVGTVKQRGLANSDRPGLYRPLAQFPSNLVFVEVRASGDPAKEAGTMQQTIADVDSTIPISDVETMDQRMIRSVATIRFASLLASLFAVVAFALGVIGVYAVLASVVDQRKRDIGIRIALGAGHARLIGTVLRQAAVLAGLGIVAGSVTAWILVRVLAGLFAGGRSYDPSFTSQGWIIVPTFLGAALAFAAVALLAAGLPAVRTTHVNPVDVLSST